MFGLLCSQMKYKNKKSLEKFLKAKEKSGINGGCGAGEKNQILAFRDCN